MVYTASRTLVARGGLETDCRVKAAAHTCGVTRCMHVDGGGSYLHSVPLTDERFEPVLADGLVVLERHLHEVVGDTRGFERRLVFELERLRVDALLETHVHRTRRRQRLGVKARVHSFIYSFSHSSN